MPVSLLILIPILFTFNRHGAKQKNRKLWLAIFFIILKYLFIQNALQQTTQNFHHSFYWKYFRWNVRFYTVLFQQET